MSMDLILNTMLILAIATVFGITVGYLIAKLRSGKIIAELTHQTNTVTEQINTLSTQLEQSEQQLSQTTAELQQLQIEQGRDAERIAGLQAT